MRGAVAAGHTLTAEAGAEVLREGGNAVDACIAAAFMSWVTESTLTSPGGGGFLLVRAASTGKVRLHDFFVAIPGHGVERPVREMDLVDVEFDRGTSQIFRVGGASCAVPGAIAGLEAAHRAYARLPWRRLLEPAIAVARDGHELVPAQAYLHGILDLILRRTEIGHEIFGPGGVPLVAGDRLVMPDLAATLEQLAEGGAEAFYAGDLGRRVCEHVREEGGSLTEEDLAAYRVITRKPIRTSFGARAFVSNPPPSSGGTLIAYALLLFSRLGPGGPPGSAEAIARLAEVMREQTLARGGSFVGDLYRGGLPKRLFAGADEAAERIVARDLESGLASTEESVGAPGTTHISVVDAAGNAASLTASNGSGSGVIVPGTGIHLNNMLGEYDLNPIGRGNQRAAVGRRLTSMMAPSIVLEGERPRLVVGSAGSIRLRGAILQLVLNVTAHGMEVGAAIGQPRVHLEGRQVHCEGGFDPAELDRLEQRGYELVRWRRRNLYFGGAAAVELREDGTLDAAGDPRRDGHGIVV
ncbi:MAG: gamma-glutamyltransferase [Actinobacteria bacterium]|nr:MAG: gamma-glutamyltransferase [Actinomycetota bacterium]